jgi:hypothetical protein
MPAIICAGVMSGRFGLTPIRVLPSTGVGVVSVI